MQAPRGDQPSIDAKGSANDSNGCVPSAAGAVSATSTGPDAKRDEKDPFSDLRMAPHDALHRAVRMKCPGACGKQRRYFCCECIVPLVDPCTAVPEVHLPVHVHIVQSGAEVPQQSTAQHVALLARGCATVWRPFPECADAVYKEVIQHADPGSVAILYVVLRLFLFWY